MREDIVDVRRETSERFGAVIGEVVNVGADDREAAAAAIPQDVFARCARAGLVALMLPRDVGGPGRDPATWGAALQEIGYLSTESAFPLLLAYRGTIAMMLLETGRPDLADRYVRPMARGEAFGGFGYSEGNDPFSFTTTARLLPDGSVVVNGMKKPVAGGLTATMFLVAARVEGTDDLMVVIVERGDEGVEVVPFGATGLRTAGLATLHLRDVTVGPARVVASSDGVSYAQRFFNDRRLEMPCWVVGRLERLREAAVDHLLATIRFGLPLSEMQAVQAAVGRLHVLVEACRALVDRGLRHVASGDQHPLWDEDVTIMKYEVVRRAREAVVIAQDIVGGAGVFTDAPFERFMRDFSCLTAIAGAQGTLEVDLGVIAIDTVRRTLARRAAPERSEAHARQAVREPASVH